MKRHVLAAAVAAVVGLSASFALAGGITRDANVGTANHAAAVHGSILTTYSGNIFPSENLNNNNPTKSFNDPYETNTGSNFNLFTDVAANPGVSGAATFNNFKSVFGSGTTVVPQARFFNWYIGYEGLARTTIGNSIESNRVESYVNNKSVVTYSDIGTSSMWRADAVVTTIVKDMGLGSALVVSELKVTRKYTSNLFDSGPAIASAQPKNFQIAVGLDLNPGSMFTNPGGGSAAPDQSGTSMSASSFVDPVSGVNKKVTYLAIDGTVGEHIGGFNPSSFGVGLFSSSAGVGFNGSILGSTPSSLGNALPPTPGDYMSGFLWNRTFAAVPTPGATTTEYFYTAFSINTPASVNGLVPEPAALGLLAPAALLLARRSRKA